MLNEFPAYPMENSTDGFWPSLWNFHIFCLKMRYSLHVMHESIPGVTIPPREHTRELDLIGYDSANARVPGHN
jgi:hypothetical protein